MKVTSTTHGGQLAATNRPPCIVESSALPELAAAELARLVAAVKAVPAIKDKRAGRAGDVQSYTITVEEDGQTTVFRQSDTAMSPAFDALRTWLQRKSAAT